jgi:EAL and modified HD-GYP domain-containing signal transduction protein
MLGRQPIFDQKIKVMGYELLFRANAYASCAERNDDQASEAVIFNAFKEVGLNQLLGPHRAFINLTRNLILNPPLYLPKERVVFEILETVLPDAQVQHALWALYQRGYCLALDDFCYRQAYIPIFKYISIIKIDIKQYTWPELKALKQKLSDFKGSWLAEKVETHIEYAACKKMGFHYFQGNFFGKPLLIKGKSSFVTHYNVAQCLINLLALDSNFQNLASTLHVFPELAQQLIKGLNRHYPRLKINSLADLSMMQSTLDWKSIRDWCLVLALSELPLYTQEAVYTPLIRGKFCSFLSSPDDFEVSCDMPYLMGLLSTFESLFNIKMSHLMHEVKAPLLVKTGLLYQTGKLGDLLKNVIAFETGHWQDLVGVSPEQCQSAYLAGIKWVAELSELQLIDVNQPLTNLKN